LSLATLGHLRSANASCVAPLRPSRCGDIYDKYNFMLHDISRWVTIRHRSGGKDAQFTRSTHACSSENRRECDSIVQSARLCVRVDRRNHGGCGAHARRLLQLFSEQGRALCRGGHLFWQRQARRQWRRTSARSRSLDRPRLSVPAAPRIGRGELSADRLAQRPLQKAIGR